MKTPAWTRHALWVMPLALGLQSAVVAGDEQPSKTSSYSPVVINEDFATIMKRMTANKPSIEQAHKTLLEQRYDLSDRPAKGASMTRGKPLQEGIRVKLPAGTSWEELARLSPEEIRKQGLFPGGFLPLPHPNHAEGGMVFPKFLIDEIKRQESRDLTRFDLDYDLPDHFLPEFPAPMFLTTRPDLGDVSKGKLVTIDNYFELFNGILNPKQLEGLRLLLTAFPQQQFNLTDDRRSEHPSRGVACFDCHANGHTNAATHLAGDVRPQPFRHRIDTPTLRGVNIQRLFGSQRALKTVEDFTEFEQRAAYFDGDPVIATKKGVNVLERGSQVHFMGEFQALLDFPRHRSWMWRAARSGQGQRAGIAWRKAVLRQGGLRRVPCAALLHRQPDAQPEGGALLRSETGQWRDGVRRRADQDLPVARDQGFAAVPARRPPADPGGHRGVLQPGAGAQAVRGREGRPGGLPAYPVRKAESQVIKNPPLRRVFGIWSERLDSNQRPSRPERDALPSCATLRFVGAHSTEKVLVHKGLDEFFFEPRFPRAKKQRPRRSFESTGSSGKPVTRRYQSSLTVRTWSLFTRARLPSSCSNS